MSEEITVSDVQFLTPAKVTLKVDGKQRVIDASIDLVNRKVYSQIEIKDLGPATFEYLDSVTTLPEDFFAASDDVQERAQQAYKELHKNRENLGDADGWGSATN
jgi:hypothetical protein